MAPRFTTTVPILRMFDTAKAKDFYVDFLGFRIDFEHRFEPALPLYMQVSLGDVKLHLSEHYGDGSPGSHVIVEMIGITEYNAALLAKTHGYARPGLEHQPWKATTMAINDPFFNMLVFTEYDAVTR